SGFCWSIPTIKNLKLHQVYITMQSSINAGSNISGLAKPPNKVIKAIGAISIAMGNNKKLKIRYMLINFMLVVCC
ncbi:MAG TPA: hypothetical protein DCL43_05210, partial [Chitinophagaceae bacterium]|nr:hypothetical protein [Chitinophagaceae bacterium]